MANIYCSPGNHTESAPRPRNGEVRLPDGWRIAPSRFEGDLATGEGEWVSAPNSGLRVYCCPEHTLKGEDR